MTPTEQAARWLADVCKHPAPFAILSDGVFRPEDQFVVGLPDALAAIARHLAPGDDLVAQATAALEGVTDGPWEADANENGAFTIDAFDGNTRILCSRGPWPSYAEASQANARFIAFTRQWVPEAAARISALTATVAKLQAEKRESALQELASLGQAQEAYEAQKAAEAEAATLRARLARMEGALIWCSAASDFAEGGVAREGWLKLCAPLIAPDVADAELLQVIVADQVAALTDGGSNG